MNLNFVKQFENVLFTEEQLPLFNNLLEIVRKTKDDDTEDYISIFDVLKLIGENSKNGKRGISKKEIQEQLMISRKVCDDIISILQGATLIQYDDTTTREQPWTVTIRGRQLAKYYYVLKGDK